MKYKNIIFCGDTHFKESLPYLNGLNSLIKYISKEFDGKDSLFIQSGDLLDSTNLHYEKVVAGVAVLLKYSFKDTIVISGNHEESYLKGNILHMLDLVDNIKVVFDHEIVKINGAKDKEPISIALFPYKKAGGMKSYSQIVCNTDFGLAHSAHKESTGVEFYPDSDIVDFSKCNIKTMFFGHTHKHEIMRDNSIILGVPQTTRNLEQYFEKCIYVYNAETQELKKVLLPIFFDIQTIEYGQTPEIKDFLYNIIKAPSKKAVFEKYKGFNIREEGIELLRTVNQINFEEQKQKMNFDLGSKFLEFSKKKKLKKEIHQEMLESLS